VRLAGNRARRAITYRVIGLEAEKLRMFNTLLMGASGQLRFAGSSNRLGRAA
jgi:hypothetical protein